MKGDDLDSFYSDGSTMPCLGNIEFHAGSSNPIDYIPDKDKPPERFEGK